MLSIERAQPPDSTGTLPEVLKRASINNYGVSEITFRVLRGYKGVDGEPIRLYSGEVNTDCAIDAKIGQTWFVYGFQGYEGKIYIKICSRTGELETSGADIRYARGEPAMPEDLTPTNEKQRDQSDPSLVERGATLSGAVRRSDGKSLRSDAVLTLWTVDKRGHRTGDIAAEQEYDSDGAFSLRHLPPGSYVLTARDSDWTPTMRFVGNYGIVELKERSRVGGVDLVLEPDPLGSMTVHVEPPEALQDGMFVLLTDSDYSDPASAKIYLQNETADLGRDGVVRFDKMPYAHYSVEVHVSGISRHYKDPPIPGWCQDETHVELDGSHTEVTVHFHKCPQI